MYIDELFKKTAKELNTISKADLIKEIVNNASSNQHRENRIETLQAEIKVAKAPYEQAKMMLIGATGFEPEIDEYSKKPRIEDVDLCFLIGLLLAPKE